ncbi:histidine kinase [Alishewanella longhuensis]
MVISISLFNTQGELLLTSNSQHDLSQETLHQQHVKPNQLNYLDQQQHLLVYQPLLKSNPLRDDDPGYLLLQFEQQHLLLEQQISLLHSGLFIAVILFLALCLAFFLIQKLQPELHRIKRQMQQLMDGQYRVRALPLTIREMDVLQTGVLQLAERLARLEQEMQQNIEQVTSDLQQSMEQLEIQNIQLDFAKRKALEDNRQKSDFLAKMSHELRTPLNAVIGFTRQLLKTPLSHHQSDYLHTIQKSANSLLNLVNDVLDFSRLEEGRMSINPEPFSLRDTLNDATELLAANAFDKQLELVLVFSPDCPDDVIADPARSRRY